MKKYVLAFSALAAAAALGPAAATRNPVVGQFQFPRWRSGSDGARAPAREPIHYHDFTLSHRRRVRSELFLRVFTSPPFALRRRKAYGNVDPAEYADWFAPFAGQIHRVLKPEGSFVFELGPAWNRGTGTRSLHANGKRAIEDLFRRSFSA